MSLHQIVQASEPGDATQESRGGKQGQRSLPRSFAVVAVFVAACILAVLSLGTSAATAVSRQQPSETQTLDVDELGDGFALLSTSVGEFVQNVDGAVTVVDDHGSKLFTVQATGILSDGSTTSAVYYKIVEHKLVVTWQTTQMPGTAPLAAANGLSWNCVLQYLGLVAGTVGVIIATGGSAVVFIVGLGTYVIDIASVLRGC